MIQPRSLEERRAALAQAVDLADEVRALAQHPEVVRWFAERERALVETILFCETEDERVMNIARARALRELKEHLTAIDAASQSALKRLNDLRNTSNAR